MMFMEYHHLDPTLLLSAPGLLLYRESREIFQYSECPRQERETCQAGQDMVTCMTTIKTAW